jgi:hypothetical protein
MAGLLEVELTQGVTNTVDADQGNFATLEKKRGGSAPTSS